MVETGPPNKRLKLAAHVGVFHLSPVRCSSSAMRYADVPGPVLRDSVQHQNTPGGLAGAGFVRSGCGAGRRSPGVRGELRDAVAEGAAA